MGSQMTYAITSVFLLLALSPGCVIWGICGAVVEDCPPNCKCDANTTEGSITVDCSQQDRPGFPSFLPRGIIHLDVSDCQMPLVGADALGQNMRNMEFVWRLTMQNCNIARIESYAFNRFPRLKILDLSFNQITHMAPDMFPANLTRLLLNDNPIDCQAIQHDLNGINNLLIECEFQDELAKGTANSAAFSECLPACENDGTCVAGNLCLCKGFFSGSRCQDSATLCLDYPRQQPYSYRNCSRYVDNESPGSGFRSCSITCDPGFIFLDGSISVNLVCHNASWKSFDLNPIQDCKPDCRPGCQNGGVCLGPGSCQCAGKFTGSMCQFGATDAKILETTAVPLTESAVSVELPGDKMYTFSSSTIMIVISMQITVLFLVGVALVMYVMKTKSFLMLSTNDDVADIISVAVPSMRSSASGRDSHLYEYISER